MSELRGHRLGEYDHKAYLRAPIIEAVIDLRVDLDESTTVEVLKAFGEAERDRYPGVQRRIDVGTSIQLESGSEPQARPLYADRGHVAVSADELQVAQATLDGFTFSRLAPYENWVPFEVEAMRLWKVYESVAKPLRLTRIAVRYINRIELGSGPIRIEDVVRTYPQISPELPQQLTGYLMQLQIPLTTHAAMLNLVETIVPGPKDEESSLIIDNDVYRELTVDIQSPTFESSLRRWLAELRVAKNEAFDACITEETKESIDR